MVLSKNLRQVWSGLLVSDRGRQSRSQTTGMTGGAPVADLSCGPVNIQIMFQQPGVTQNVMYGELMTNSEIFSK